MTTRVQRITAYLGEYEEVIPASNSTFSRVQKILPADDVALITTTPTARGAVTNRTEYAHRDVTVKTTPLFPMLIGTRPKLSMTDVIGFSVLVPPWRDVRGVGL